MGKWRVFALRAASSLIWGGWGFAVPFYFVQDCSNGSGGCPGGMVTGQIEVRINKTFNLSGGGGGGLGTCDLKKAP